MNIKNYSTRTYAEYGDVSLDFISAVYIANLLCYCINSIIVIMVISSILIVALLSQETVYGQIIVFS